MKPWLFISDLHLSPERPEVIQLFARFCQQVASKADRLYILGDLVEYWIGDDADDDALAVAFDSLKRLTETGIEVNFMAGNRDFLIGEQLAAKYSFNIIAEPLVITYHEAPVLLMHGDSLCTDDTDYQNFRNMVRDRQWQQDFLSKSLSEREAIARSVRNTSKQENSEKDEYIMDVNQQAVEFCMRENNCNTFIHGHTHRPAVHEFELDGEPAKRYVLSDWYETGSYIVLSDNDDIELVRYP